MQAFQKGNAYMSDQNSYCLLKLFRKPGKKSTCLTFKRPQEKFTSFLFLYRNQSASALCAFWLLCFSTNWNICEHSMTPHPLSWAKGCIKRTAIGFIMALWILPSPCASQFSHLICEISLCQKTKGICNFWIQNHRKWCAGGRKYILTLVLSF